MTVTSEKYKIICAGNGSTTSFAYDFRIDQEGDEEVIYTDASGTETTLTRGTGASNYTISGTGEDSGGTVTYPNSGSPIASGTTLTIKRNLPVTQGLPLSNQGAMFPSSVETVLDRLTMIVQAVNGLLNRTLRAPVTDDDEILEIPNATSRASKILAFDADGNITTAEEVPEGTVSSAMSSVIGAATLALGRTAFGLGECAVEDIGAGLVDKSGDLTVVAETQAIDANTSITSAYHQTQLLVTGTRTLTLDADLFSGFSFVVHALTADVTVTSTSPELFYGGGAGGSTTVSQGEAAIFVCDGSGVWHVFTSSVPGLSELQLATTVQEVTGGDLSIDMDDGWYVDLTLNADVDSFSVSNPPSSGTLGKLTLEVASGGAYDINAWPSGTIWASGAAPTMTASGKDTFVLTTIDGGTSWRGYTAAQDMS
jgi:hypothetical protein